MDEQARTPIWRFLAYMKPYWSYVADSTVAGIVKFLAPLTFPWILRIMLDEVVPKEGLAASQRERLIWQLVLTMFGVNVIWLLAFYYRGVWGAVAGHQMIRDLRVALFDHLQRLSHSFFARHQTGAIVPRVVNDLSLARNFVGTALTNIWMDVILVMALIFILLSIHPVMTLVAVMILPLYVISLRMVGLGIRLATLESQQRLEILAGGLQEKMAGMAVVKGFSREHQETQVFASQANELLHRILSTARFSALNEMLVGLVVHTSPVLVLWYGVHQILNGALTVGELTQFLLYLAMFYIPLQRLSDLSVVLANALAAVERIFEFFDTQPQVSERMGARGRALLGSSTEQGRIQAGTTPENTTV